MMSHLDRTDWENKVVANKLNRMAYRVCRQVKLLNNFLSELDLHRRMRELEMDIIDQDHAEAVVKKAHKIVTRELKRLQVLLELKERRENDGIDLKEDIGLLEETSRDALAELATELEINPDAILSSLQNSLQTDNLNAELGDVDAMRRARETRGAEASPKQKVAQQLAAKATP